MLVTTLDATEFRALCNGEMQYMCQWTPGRALASCRSEEKTVSALAVFSLYIECIPVFEKVSLCRQIREACLLCFLASDIYQITRLPIDPITVGRRWGQRHPQGANSGPIGRLNSQPSLKHGCHQPTLIPCQPMYIRPAHFDLLKVDLLSKSTANQAV
jgi:hypothetical protein